MVGLADPVIWHDVECGGYEADLPLWRDLADAAGGPLLEIGSGTGRVALDLAARGFDVAALDSDAALVGALDERARERALAVPASVADARSFVLPRDGFALIFAPMQVVQLMGGPDGRASMLARVREHLAPGGVFAAALADPFDGFPAEEVGPPLPDVREQDGFVYSSLPLGALSDGDSLLVDRLRQLVDPGGRLTESRDQVRLQLISAEQLEAEAGAAGLRPAGRRRIEATDSHVGSTVVLLEVD